MRQHQGELVRQRAPAPGSHRCSSMASTARRRRRAATAPRDSASATRSTIDAGTFTVVEPCSPVAPETYSTEAPPLTTVGRELSDQSSPSRAGRRRGRRAPGRRPPQPVATPNAATPSSSSRPTSGDVGSQRRREGCSARLVTSVGSWATILCSSSRSSGPGSSPNCSPSACGPAGTRPAPPAGVPTRTAPASATPTNAREPATWRRVAPCRRSRLTPPPVRQTRLGEFLVGDEPTLLERHARSLRANSSSANSISAGPCQSVERSVEQVHRGHEVSEAELGRTLVGKGLEAGRRRPLGRDRQPVAARAGLDRVAGSGERLTQPDHVRLQRLGCRRRRVVAPHRVDQRLDRHDPTGPAREQRQAAGAVAGRRRGGVAPPNSTCIGPEKRHARPGRIAPVRRRRPRQPAHRP